MNLKHKLTLSHGNLERHEVHSALVDYEIPTSKKKKAFWTAT